MKRISVICAGIMLTASIAFAQDTEFQPKEWGGKMTLNKGTMQLGGAVSVDIDVIMPEEGDSVTGFTFDLSPSVGYFVTDGFMLEGMVSLQFRGGDLYENAGIPLLFMAGGRYYIVGSGSIIPFLGARIGMFFDMPDEGDTQKSLMISVPLGLLWPLNQWVALTLGASWQVQMSLEDHGGTYMFIPIGFLGMEAFF